MRDIGKTPLRQVNRSFDIKTQYIIVAIIALIDDMKMRKWHIFFGMKIFVQQEGFRLLFVNQLVFDCNEIVRSTNKLDFIG